jgi:hypothetical protein
MTKLYKDMTPEEKEKIKQSTEKYRKANPEKYREAALKQYYKDPVKAAARAKKYREENKEHIRTKQREDKRNRKLFAIDYLGGCCSKCSGKFHPAIYEFHHIDPKTKDRDPSKMLSLSKENLILELNKCILLCANCHRLEHHGDNY